MAAAIIATVKRMICWDTEEVYNDEDWGSMSSILIQLDEVASDFLLASQRILTVILGTRVCGVELGRATRINESQGMILL
jgi:hypothetical protein